MSGAICLAVYQPSLELLSTQLSSIQTQTIRDWVCIVGIDGHDPQTYDQVCKILKGDPRFAVHHFEENIGFYRNFERILREVPADADWVALADQDDEWFYDKLEHLVPELETRPMSVGQLVVKDHSTGESSRLSERRNPQLVGNLIDNQVAGSACVFKTSLLKAALPFPPSTDYAFHDHWLAVCALALGGIVWVDRPVQFYVQHAQNVIGEDGRSSIFARISKLVTLARTTGSGPLHYLCDHRWGWRVNMAHALLEADAAVAPEDSTLLTLFARGTLSPRLIASLACAVTQGQAPIARSMGLLIGSAVGPPKAIVRGNPTD